MTASSLSSIENLRRAAILCTTAQFFFENNEAGQTFTFMKAFLCAANTAKLERLIEQRNVCLDKCLNQPSAAKRAKIVANYHQVKFDNVNQMYRIWGVKPSEYLLDAWNNTNASACLDTKYKTICRYIAITLKNNWDTHDAVKLQAKAFCAWFYSPYPQHRIDTSYSMHMMVYCKLRKDKLIGQDFYKIAGQYAQTFKRPHVCSKRLGYLFYLLYRKYINNECSFEYVEWAICLFYLKILPSKPPDKKTTKMLTQKQPILSFPSQTKIFISCNPSLWIPTMNYSTKLRDYTNGFRKLMHVFKMILETICTQFISCQIRSIEEESSNVVIYNDQAEFFQEWVLSNPMKEIYPEVEIMMRDMSCDTRKSWRAYVVVIHYMFTYLIWSSYNIDQNIPTWNPDNDHKLVFKKSILFN